MSVRASADNPRPKEYGRAVPTLPSLLREAEDVVDEETTRPALVAEVFSDREARESDASACARRFVHLTVNECALGTRSRTTVLLGILVDVRFDHFVIEVVAFTRTLTHACEHGVAAVCLRNVVDDSMMRTVLPTPAPPNRPILPPLAVGASRSTTLMPVTRICASVADLRTSARAGGWRGPPSRRSDLLRPPAHR